MCCIQGVDIITGTPVQETNPEQWFCDKHYLRKVIIAQFLSETVREELIL